MKIDLSFEDIADLQKFIKTLQDVWQLGMAGR